MVFFIIISAHADWRIRILLPQYSEHVLIQHKSHCEVRACEGCIHSFTIRNKARNRYLKFIRDTYKIPLQCVVIMDQFRVIGFSSNKKKHFINCVNNNLTLTTYTPFSISLKYFV